MNKEQATLIQMKTMIEEALSLIRLQEVMFHENKTKKALLINNEISQNLYVAKLSIESQLSKE